MIIHFMSQNRSSKLIISKIWEIFIYEAFCGFYALISLHELTNCNRHKKGLSLSFAKSQREIMYSVYSYSISEEQNTYD